MTFSVSPAGGKHGRGGPAACGRLTFELCAATIAAHDGQTGDDSIMNLCR